MRKVTLVSASSDNIKHVALALTDTGFVTAMNYEGLSEAIGQYGASKKQDSSVQVPLADKILIITGVGDNIAYREFAASASRAGKRKPALSIDISAATESEVMAAAEGCLLGLDTPNKYKDSDVALQEIELVVNEEL